MNLSIPSYFRFSSNSLFFFLLIYIFSLSPVILDGSIQYLFEFFFIIIFSPFAFKRHPRSLLYLFIVYFFVGLSLFYLQFDSFLLTFKLFTIIFASICCSFCFDNLGSSLRPVINIFFCINLLATLFLPTSFSTLIAHQDGLVTSGSGGLFFHFHLNAFMTALWFFSLPFKSLFFLFPSLVFLFKTNSNYIAFSYLFAILIRDFSPWFLRLFTRQKFVSYVIIAFFFVSTFGLILLNREYLSLFLFNFNKSAYVIFEQFFMSLDVLPGLFPGDINQLYSHYFVYERLSDADAQISNEIAFISMSYRFGVLAFVFFLLFIYKFFKKSFVFLCFTLLHYTFLYTPMTYILLQNINRSSTISPSRASSV